MRTNLPMNKSLIAALTAFPTLLHAQENKAPTPKLSQEIEFEEKGVFGPKHPYSPTLGFTLWKSPGTTLKEHVELPLIETPKVRQELIKQVKAESGGDKLSEVEIEKRVEKLKEKFTIPVWDEEKKTVSYLSAEEYEKHRLTSSLRIYRTEGGKMFEDGSAILFGIRDSFSFYNYSQPGFAGDFSSNDGKDTMRLKGALISDIYLDPLYNHGLKMPWNNDQYRFSLRTGVEFNIDETAETPVDQTSVYLLANFQANPDLDAHLFGIKDFWQITSPQFLQVGVAWDHEDYTGKDDLRWIVNWQPRFYLLNDRGFLARSLGINTLMRFDKTGPFSFNLNKKPVTNKAETAGSKERVADDNRKDDKGNNIEESSWYTFIPADVRLSGGSEVWDALRSGEGLDKVTVESKLGFVIGNSDWGFRTGYLAEIVSPVSDLGNSHIGQSFFAEMGLGNFTGKIAGDKEPKETIPLPKADIGAATIFAKYSFGERAPDFKNEDLFQVGLRMRF